ncbi:OB-fold-like, putative isoform 2 [Hibiscus syriacus]|uniref:OB-fold-like, putative isoform 2 n=1 Tax=Hibiscus syriacus TaxID=106335 RepID=A0A6A2XVA5_HIBSY|nr:OB-fold-like, putative isoform 2 [Hibiscus syriacus]
MGKKNKKGEAEINSPDETLARLSLLNADAAGSHNKKKQKPKAEKVTDGETKKADEIPTVTIAIAGSIVDNAQSLELATRLAGQFARAATIFRIDEYLETPQYLRKTLFPKHNTLRYVGMLPPLDAPHHLRKHEWAPYREAKSSSVVSWGILAICITLEEKPTSSVGTMVDVGLDKNVVVDQALKPGIRVTVAMGTNQDMDYDLPRQVVSSSKPREDAGTYWGYKVRYASDISSAFSDCPYKGGYDHLIGTSEHGLVVNSSQLNLPAFRHLSIAFGGLTGLEKSVDKDH